MSKQEVPGRPLIISYYIPAGHERKTTFFSISQPAGRNYIPYTIKYMY